ncbi:MAG: ABC transporter ATP-binding protein [Chloroflexota bacterium]
MTAASRSTRSHPLARVTLGHVLPMFKPWRWLVLVVALLVAASAVLGLAPAYIMRQLIDHNLKEGRLEGLLGLALLYLSATTALAALGFGRTYLAARVGQGILRQLRVRLYAHLQGLPTAFFDRTPLGDIISRCTADMDAINTLFSAAMIGLLAEALQAVAALVALVTLSPLLSSLMLVVLPILYGLTRAFQVRMRDAERRVRLAVGAVNARLQEALANAEVLKALHWEFPFVRRLRRALAEMLVHADRSIWYGGVYDPVMNVIEAAIVALLLWSATTQAYALAGLSIGTLTASILLFGRFFAPIIAIGSDWQEVQSALAGLERVFEILNLPADDDAVETLHPASALAASSLQAEAAVLVAAEHVTFGYNPGQPVLQDVSFTVRSGEHVAIVGRTGAGKSSLLSLLGGLYRPWEGALRLAGADPYALAAEERRHVVGTVPQMAQLFSGSLRDNLTLGDEAAPAETVRRAADLAGVAGFLGDLAQGYETVLSDRGRGRGAQLSVGQRQLVALARALVGDPAVLLLDEATASVDSATEAALKRALRAHLQERGGAVLTIAHRLSTALEADRIVVLENGRVTEMGTPQALLVPGTQLYSYWELENAGWEWRQRL